MSETFPRVKMFIPATLTFSFIHDRSLSQLTNKWCYKKVKTKIFFSPFHSQSRLSLSSSPVGNLCLAGTSSTLLLAVNLQC